MRPRVVFNTASTLDGYLADPANSLDWLFAVDQSVAPDLELFMERIGVLVSGSTTYEWVLDHEDLIAKPEKWQGFYGDRPWFVFTTRELPVPEGADVHFVRGTPAENIEAIGEAADGKDAWLFGGGQLVGEFFDAGLLDEVQVTFAPATLGEGAQLLPRRIGPERLRLDSAERFGQFAHLIYSVRPE